ncbi:MAG: diguanylate cyclase [Longimicrobiaceae bacterium]
MSSTLAALLLLSSLPDTTGAVVGLGGVWRFQTGDNPEYASPALDHSGWEGIRVPGRWERNHPGYDGVGWYRRTVTLPPVARSGTVAVEVGTVGDAYQLFWNGVKIGEAGGFPPNFHEAIGRKLFPVPSPALAAAEDGVHTVAVRVHNEYRYGGLIGQLRVGRYDRMVPAGLGADPFVFALAAVFLAVGVYHLAFFLRRIPARENLYFSLICLLFAVYGLTYAPTVAAGMAPFISPYRLQLLMVFTIVPVFLSLACRLFGLHATWWERVVGGVFLLGIPLGAVVPMTWVGWFHDVGNLVMVAALVITVVRAARVVTLRAPHARILLAGSGAVAATVGWDVLSLFGVVPQLRVIPDVFGVFWFGALAFLLSVGLATARQFADAEVTARSDTLTGLDRRHVLELSLELELRRLERTGGKVSLVMIDLDYFKQINDRYGHRKGDEVLVRVSRVLRHSARNIDVIARWGGEEFAVLLCDSDVDGALAFASRWREHLRGLELPTSDGRLRVSASAGIASGVVGISPERLIDAADRALYRAKREGKDRTRAVSLSVAPEGGVVEREVPVPEPEITLQNTGT